MSQLRLLFVSNFYPPYDIGGYEKHCQEVADGLRRRGHNVQILTSRHGVAASVQEGHIKRAFHLESDLGHYRPLRFFLRRGCEERFNVEMLRSTIADSRPDVVVFWGMWNLSRRLPSVAESSGIPVAYWLGDLWPIDLDMHTRYWHSSAHSRLGRFIMPGASYLALRRLAAEGYPPTPRYRHVACGSRFLKRKLAAEIPAFGDARVVLCGIDLTPFADCEPHAGLFDPVAPRIIYVGSLGAHKGVHTVVEAISRLMSKSPNLQPSLTIVGGGHPDYEARLRQMVVEGGMTERVRFMGTTPKEKLPFLMTEHDIMAVPSVVEEGFGRVIIEGMAAGLAVVGTATGGSGEILTEGNNGLVFPAENADALADCVLRLARDPVLYARLARTGKATSERFALRHMIDGIERFLIDVVATDEHGTKR